jgi:hypothetical protein
VALRLLEAGLRPRVIGHVLKELTRYTALAPKLKISNEVARTLYLFIWVSPQRNRPLDVSRIKHVEFVEGLGEVEDFLDRIVEGLKAEGLSDVETLVNNDVLLVAVGLMFHKINGRLEVMERESSEAER